MKKTEELIGQHGIKFDNMVSCWQNSKIIISSGHSSKESHIQL